jgi:uncharacterized protein (TIGR00251 family)
VFSELAPCVVKKEIETIRLAIRVIPNAKRNEVVEFTSLLELRVKIHAPARDDRANLEMIRFLAELLGCRRSELTLVRGERSRSKIVTVSGLNREEIAERLAAIVSKDASAGK